MAGIPYCYSSFLAMQRMGNRFKVSSVIFFTKKVGYFNQKLKKFIFLNLNYKFDIFKIILIQIEILSNQ